MTKVQKQLSIEIDDEVDAKLKRLAAARGCGEEDVLREAIERLPDVEPEPAWVSRLRSRGLLVESGPPRTTREGREAMLADLHQKLRARGATPRLTEAILEERDESDRRL